MSVFCSSVAVSMGLLDVCEFMYFIFSIKMEIFIYCQFEARQRELLICERPSPEAAQ